MLIKDSGKGLEMSEFERYFLNKQEQGDEDAKMSLGLPVSCAIIASNGGEIKALCKGKDQGTQITFNMKFERAMV